MSDADLSERLTVSNFSGFTVSTDQLPSPTAEFKASETDRTQLEQFSVVLKTMAYMYEEVFIRVLQFRSARTSKFNDSPKEKPKVNCSYFFKYRATVKCEIETSYLQAGGLILPIHVYF
jgi:hypothetical protein